VNEQSKPEIIENPVVKHVVEIFKLQNEIIKILAESSFVFIPREPGVSWEDVKKLF